MRKRFFLKKKTKTLKKAYDYNIFWYSLYSTIFPLINLFNACTAFGTHVTVNPLTNVVNALDLTLANERKIDSILKSGGKLTLAHTLLLFR
jgi:hypothetical protein